MLAFWPLSERYPEAVEGTVASTLARCSKVTVCCAVQLWSVGQVARDNLDLAQKHEGPV